MREMESTRKESEKISVVTITAEGDTIAIKIYLAPDDANSL
jgi:hypothetical protein